MQIVVPDLSCDEVQRTKEGLSVKVRLVLSCRNKDLLEVAVRIGGDALDDVLSHVHLLAEWRKVVLIAGVCLPQVVAGVVAVHAQHQDGAAVKAGEPPLADWT